MPKRLFRGCVGRGLGGLSDFAINFKHLIRVGSGCVALKAEETGLPGGERDARDSDGLFRIVRGQGKKFAEFSPLLRITDRERCVARKSSSDEAGSALD